MKINLLPKEERPLKHSQVRWEFLVGLLGLVALAAALSFSWLEGVRVESLEAALRDAQVREARLQVQVRDVNALRQEIAALEAQEDLLQGLLGGTGHAAAALGAVGSFSLERLWIEEVAYTPQATTVTGYTRDVTSLSAYLSRLQALGEGAELKQAQPMDSSDFQVFVIEVKGVPRVAAVEQN
ncbi:MAG TPA: hypothetical protein PLM25_05775 [Limnochordia bacterium]|jgi:hypothetical protein|nr:hypothetical protein [Limnochordia bacterium]